MSFVNTLNKPNFNHFAQCLVLILYLETPWAPSLIFRHFDFISSNTMLDLIETAKIHRYVVFTCFCSSLSDCSTENSKIGFLVRHLGTAAMLEEKNLNA